MTESSVVVVDRDDDFARITINRPERRNALSPEVVAGLRRSLAQLEDDPSVRAIVLTGAGDKAFCAGGDLGGMTPEGALAQHEQRAELGELFDSMRSSRLPIVAAVNGHALGGGFGLMLACDLVVAVQDASLGTPEINLGLWPFIITAVIQRDVPRKIAMEMMLTGKRIDAGEAERWGFVNRAVQRDGFDAAVNELASSVASKSAAIVSMGKRSFYRAQDMDMRHAVDYLAGMLSVCLQSEDTAEGVSAFLQKRPPQWKDR